MNRILLCVMLSFSTLSGCDGSQTRVAPDATPDLSSSQFTITKVTWDAKGRDHVEIIPVTGDLMAGKAEALSKMRNGTARPDDYGAWQVGCSASSLELFDKSLVDCRYGCNEICLAPQIGDRCPGPLGNYVYLGNYCHTAACTESWNGLIRSYWSGSIGGDDVYLSRIYHDGYDGFEPVSAPYSYGNAGTYGRAANYVQFATCGE